MSHAIVQAKVVCGSHKPNGQAVLLHSHAPHFWAALPIQHVPGIGPTLQKALSDSGVAVCGDVEGWDAMLLTMTVGARKAAEVARLLRGCDTSAVRDAQPQKTVTVDQSCRPATAPYSACDTFADLGAAVGAACGVLCTRLQGLRRTARRLTVKYRIYQQRYSCVSRTCAVQPLVFASPENLSAKAMALYRDMATEPLQMSRIILTASELLPEAGHSDLRPAGLHSGAEGTCAGAAASSGSGQSTLPVQGLPNGRAKQRSAGSLGPGDGQRAVKQQRITAFFK